MPPKTRSSGKVIGTVVTKKVIEETVKVVVSPNQTGVDNNISSANLTNIVDQGISSTSSTHVEVISSSTKENEKVEVISTPPDYVVETPPTTPATKTIVVEESGLKGQKNHKEELDEEELMNEKGGDVGGQPGISTPPREEKTLGKEGAKKRKATEDGGGKKRKKKRAKVGSGGVGITSIVYKRYVYRVLKQVHPDLGISSKAMTVINNMMNDMCERIAEESSRLSNYSGKKTLSSWDIQDAVKLVLPGELGKHAIAEGSKAVGLYVSTVLAQQSNKKTKKPKSS
ncbi:OLC1v1003744C1 [Oldenlandia corymbosa var. corymbosa]|uniref:OLC1v1003744C1 n=1 Tax=Oldenlandia corymbosa var. corymbosa TaxID=529605 RepID=A0AAV1DAQ4_OLDCO|nr:OLC1v1003744C1 [Oldenlandia corymbosa var. corymbosa]